MTAERSKKLGVVPAKAGTTSVEAMTYWVYILASRRHGTLYIGATNDLGRRVEEHRLGRGSEFVKKYGVYRLVHAEPFENPDEAIRREKQLKVWKRDWKIALIEKENLDWNDLSGLIVGKE